MSKKYAKVNVVVGKVQELTEEQQNCDVLCVKMFQTDKDLEIAKLQDQLALTEKALELACDKIEHIFESDYSTAWFYAEDNKTIIERDKFEDYFKTKPKEMMKSE